MSGLGTGISAFVNGFVGGRDVRNRWDDRKLTNERQKRLDEIRDNAETRAQQSHDMSMQTHELGLQSSRLMNDARAQAIRATNQEWDDSQSMRRALAEADAAASGGLVTAGVSSMGAVPMLAEAADMPEQIIPSQAAPQVQAAPAAMGAIPPTPIARAAQADRPQATTGQSTGGGASGSWADAAPEPIMDGDTMIPPPMRVEGDVTPATDNRHQWGKSGGLVDDIDQAGTMLGRGLGAVIDTGVSGAQATAESITNRGVDGIRMINAPFQAASTYITGKDYIGAPEREDLNGDGVKQTASGPAMEAAWNGLKADGDAPKTGPASESPAEARVSSKAAEVMDEVGNSPAMQAAADAVPAQSMGATRGRPMTEAKRDEGAKALMESYRKNGAPIVMRELLRQGRIEEASKFEDFISSGTAKAGMEAWGKGLFAAMQGDIDSAADNLMDAYNSAGYFDDGFEIVKDDSALIKDDGGEVIGIRLAMKNQETGEIVVQEDAIDNFIQKALWITSPEKAMEAASARIQAQQDALLKAQEQQTKMATDLIKLDYQAERRAQDEAAKYLFEQGNDMLNQNGGMTMEEARRKALGLGDPAEDPLAGPPVARRAQ